MICLKENKFFYILFIVGIVSCKKNRLPVIEPVTITEQTPFDTDDPAIWVNKQDPMKSLVFGTDKNELNGGVYAFDLNGKIINDLSIKGLSYPNNVDVTYDFVLNDSLTIDLMAFTEREKNQIRLFSVPDIRPLDNGGFKVFRDEEKITYRRPMGIAFYNDKESGSTYVIVSRKQGPLNNYLYQYQLIQGGDGINMKLVRKFGKFSGNKEIEAIAVDEDLGFIYYSDEDHCVRKYYADPNKGNEEIACFGGELFERDIEGIAIVKNTVSKGYLVISNQQAHSFSVFDRITNKYIKELNLGTVETDGCDVVNIPLGKDYPNGIFISMTDSKSFYFHDLGSLNLN